MKLVYLVLDGAADSLEHRPTPLEAAETPGLDSLARRARGGMHFSVGRGYAPESDAAVLSLLGYDPGKYYTGRGPLEALGAGIRIREGWEVAFRANFATVDPGSRRIIDRRAGRSLSSDEAHKLAEALDNMELMGGEAYARVRATIGHRAVVVLGHRRHRLSGNVDNTDPAYVRRGRVSVAVPEPLFIIRQARPLDPSPEARLTAQLANEFTDKAIEVLDDHPVNRDRAARGLPKANAV
ncbi:MAG: phosphonopyruvate decarboxylase, partial [Candidatus Korarchaeota archaeon]|nr:phosphonopyruvate decarboxylase [Candidatus Korarchaeota archaeon]